MAVGSRLMDKVVERMKKAKIKDSNEEFEVLYPTGFLSLDYLNGSMIHVNGNGIDMRYRSVGIVDGSSNMFIGRSGCGKSTLVFQIIGNIARQFPNCEVYIDDIEGSLPMSRKERLLGLSPDEMQANSPNCRVRFRNTGINTENVYQRILFIHDSKVENRSEYEYDTGLYDTYGNRIFKLIPTIYLIDSFAMLMPEDVLDKDELDAGMGPTKVAKVNTNLVKKISQLLRDANIILCSINHINDDPSTGFLPKPAQISGLKQGERLPGGKAALYIANNMFRLDDRAALKESEGYGIAGQVVDISLVKSRTNQNKRSVPLIFNKTEGGFDPILSMLHLLNSEGKVGGAGSRCYFIDEPDIKFSKKNFKAELEESPDLQRVFTLQCRDVLDKLLSDTENQSAIKSKFNLLDALNSLNAPEPVMT
jgi:RecA/RadA recombinase